MNNITLYKKKKKKPELKQTKTNKYMSDFSIAVNRGIKNEDGEYEVDYINCRCWNKAAENLCNYQDKGNLIIVEGSLRVENYTDKDGNNRYLTYVLANNIEYTIRKQVTEKEEAQAQAENTINNWDSAKDMDITPEDLPFY